MIKYILFTICVLNVLSTHANISEDTIPQMSANRSYVYSQTMLDSTGNKVLSEVNYYDGLGRVTQVVRPFVTPSGADISLYNEYDTIGRVWKEWLPAIVKDNNGAFVNNISDKLLSQYNDIRPFFTNEYENCPLDRVRAKKVPGMDCPDYIWSTINFWTGRKDDLDFLSCKFYEIDKDSLIYNSDYDNGELFVVNEIDEDERESYAFYDKLERIVLTRQASGSKFLDTYYIYDDLNNLRYVLLPKYQEDPNLDLYAYQYKYDHRNRCIGKKMPGVDWITYLYDKVDHLIYSQDGAQRQRREWTYYVSDDLGREVITGIGMSSSDSLPDISNIIVRAERYDYPRATGVGYLVFNLLGMNITNPLVVKFYDNYEFLNIKDSYLNHLKSGFEELSESDKKHFENAHVCRQSTKGLLTGVFVNSPERGLGIMKSIYYDDKQNVIQTCSENHMGGYSKEWYTYSYSGLMLKHLCIHSGNSVDSIKELYEYTYDHATRLTQVDHTLNNKSKVTIASYLYDELGRLSKKMLHNRQFVQEFTYNIRNSLKSVSSPFFEQKLYYTENEEGNTPQYNGNVGSILWKVHGDIKRGYNFSYDKFNRLTSANYRENSYQTSHYDTQYSYDSMGNLTKIFRNGLIDKNPELTFGEIDRLFLAYNGNQLKQVIDSAIVDGKQFVDDQSFIDGINTDVEYVYDKSGNLIKDLNKGITRIEYNSLNLPLRLEFDNGHIVEYHYGGDGTKYQVSHKDTTKNVIDYCGNVIYENTNIKKILTKEGFITIEDSNPVYHYYISDHLGSHRVVLREDSLVEQVNHYYPFGGLFGESDSGQIQNNKFSGKELDSYNKLNWYDFGARMYDTALGRWHVMDPMCERYYSLSPYQYCKNSPVRMVDPDGKQVIPVPFGPVPVPLPFYYPISQPNYRYPSTEEIVQSIKTEVNTIKSSFKAFSVLMGLTTISTAVQVKEALSPEFKHQRDRDRRNKEDLDLNQANVARSIDTNISGNMPNGDPAPKRDPKDGGIKTKIGMGLGVIGAATEGMLEITNSDPNKDAVTSHTDSEKLRIENREQTIWDKLINKFFNK